VSKYIKLLSVAGLACVPAVSFAATTLSDVLEASGITATGYLSASYSTNFNDGNQLGGRTFDGTTDSFTFNQAALTVSKLPTEGFGALVNVVAGNDATVINGSYGDGDSKFNLTQAFVQYAVGGLTVIGGRYVTLSGFEVINEAATPHIAHGYLYQNAEPLVHTGLRASYKFNDTITAYLGLNNSAIGGAATDNNKLKTIESGVLLTPIKPLSVGLYNYYGFDNIGGEDVASNLLDLVVSYSVTDNLSVTVNGDYARFFSTSVTPGFEIKGVATYAAYKINDLFTVRGRFEYANSKLDAVKSNNILTYTGTLVFSPASSFDILGEVRYDTSKKSQPIFPDGAGVKDSQGDIAVKVVYKF